eukprot:CAMPEP_0116150196 /NCGR_PEP_ID=MMETSP0329-20121206/19405_1 /TAXON_ID=697910 /ORGANISM="Pseudo-nitzschia arenysensis, Strain B593" /LENGTH=94 /DNA_ID=CAMNT_0003646667 /DNA_START=336 /DNA_END=617 /DNA_ORIENTATION=-
MSFSPTWKTYLYTCLFEERDELKKLGARWDATKGAWYVPVGLPLEPFNKWHPNFSCSYHDKEEAKLAGAEWDCLHHQLLFSPYDTKAEARLARW